MEDFIIQYFYKLTCLSLIIFVLYLLSTYGENYSKTNFYISLAICTAFAILGNLDYEFTIIDLIIIVVFVFYNYFNINNNEEEKKNER